ncbi:hypothetical protein [Aquimarina sp. I32.4]|uniref:hypothetical protein n=1 Tax=Aquimarina sp. I32.4 TaxID=2053903 RepID=UPI000CDE6D76|nr:hypothetical protein [Aquimarina sp. I32.4]
MINLDIKVKPILFTENRDLWIFTGEVNQMTSSEIQNGIDTCVYAMEGKQTGYSWGLEVFELLIEKEISTLEYHGDFVTEISTKEILKMLQDYKNALDYFETQNSIESS